MVLIYLLAITFFLCISFSTVIFASKCSRTKMGAGGISYVEYFCCSYFVEKNGECEACPNGYTSHEETKICEPCPSGKYGAKCANRCTCKAKESCDNVRGCVVTVQPTASMFSTQPTMKSKEKAKNNNSDVVIFMSCIAGVGCVVAVSAGLCKCRHSRVHKLNKRKQKRTKINMNNNTGINMKTDVPDVLGNETELAENQYEVIDDKLVKISLMDNGIHTDNVGRVGRPMAHQTELQIQESGNEYDVIDDKYIMKSFDVK